MLRDRSSSETLLTYSTFFALSLAIHMVVILKGRPNADDARTEQPQASARDDDAPGGRRR